MTIEQKLKIISNDYSKFETYFLRKTKHQLLSEKLFPASTALSVSMIIPAHQAQNTLPPVLKAISRQSFLKQGGDLEILIVDDASSPPLASTIEPFENKLHIVSIRTSSNEGAGSARDRAILLAKNDLVVFIDADIVLPPTFLSNHVFIHSQAAEPLISVSFRENVSELDRRILGKSTWGQGDRFGGDHRVSMRFKSNWVMKPSENKYVGHEFHLLEQTNNFKEFGNGRVVELWTLPMMVLTCAMSVRREIVLAASPTPKELHGWGFNDTCLAAKMISSGAKVIPNFNSSVLHILEKKHTKPDHLKNKEFLRNEKVYKKLLKQELYGKK
ncbi:MAG: Glycosyl transferase family 2 [Candidatus Uhrbacteria bacterium GW2011_GWA2_53_10]|uniref:Glycosyl transferase family 2 n=1 Tax=Candidatus Uhrbacteria bacterium GW2011_GWA2_53_10 TaxID=1618980 RepID=A0A0G1ZUZ9_9BACT|nr:MAG: Glycosyl transferase family 2 [Candidatus Uhrbacteria bacterium GW2011_GWA2_53_10]